MCSTSFERNLGHGHCPSLSHIHLPSSNLMFALRSTAGQSEGAPLQERAPLVSCIPGLKPYDHAKSGIVLPKEAGVYPGLAAKRKEVEL